MELQLDILFLGFSLILYALLFQESAGIGLPSWSVAPMFLPTKVESSEPTLNGGIFRFLLLRDDPAPSPTSIHTSSGLKGRKGFASSPHLKVFHAQPPLYHPTIRAPNPQKLYTTSNANAPSKLAPSRPAFSPFASTHKNHHFWRKAHHVAPDPCPELPTVSYRRKGPAIAPSPSALPCLQGRISSGHLPLPAIPKRPHLYVPKPSPSISPVSYPMINSDTTAPPLQSVILRPPPNHGCASLRCTEPLTNTPPGAPCGCVWPIEVRLRFSISPYTFFPLVPELAEEIAAATPLNRSQVRIMGADAAEQQLEKTTVLINLVPLDEMFNTSTAFSVYTKFWKKELSIKASVFGTYEVLYVRYPGLPPSPPSRPSSSATINVPPYSGSNDDGPIKPLGVDVPRRRKHDSGKNVVIIIVLSSVTAVIVCMAFILLLLSKCGCCSYLHRQSQQGLISSDRKPSGSRRILTLRSRPSSASMSFSSSLLACTGTSKIFSIADIMRATDNFSTSRTLGEGGFGLVYGGILDDGRKVAVKVLKREDQQGSREFLAEVEMLGRLHHRNLVKLIGICPEDQCRCLIYELVPNGSVESHLHGADKEIGPLNWCARMKIALGSARGLAYLHEDSSPHVIHRDFKSSNILLEHDYTPKVSDFGLARAALEEENKHISTHVMGTFGYLAPEYALTGHLLVKSDVYSYGVVLLELLTGRKPVDLLQPPGQENLVAWALPLLATKDGLETIIDPAIRSDIPLDSYAKVAAIASMCVQPEVSHRPFMGEVVQALKLMCKEYEGTREPISRSCSQEEFLIDIGSKHSRLTDELMEDLDKCDSTFDTKIALSAVDLKGASAGSQGQESESFRRQFNSALLNVERKRKFWQSLGLSRGSMSEHEISSKL